MSMLLVNTTNGAEIPVGFVQLSANLRETKDTTVSPEQRYRNIIIQEFNVPSVENKFRPVLLVKLYELAKQRFERDMEDSNRMATQLPASDYTVDALLSWFATDVKSGRMTKESVIAWFGSSTVGSLVLEKKGAAEHKKWLELFGKLASPNHGINPNTCRVLLAALQPADLETDMGKHLASILQKKIDSAETQLVEGL